MIGHVQDSLDDLCKWLSDNPNQTMFRDIEDQLEKVEKKYFPTAVEGIRDLAQAAKTSWEETRPKDYYVGHARQEERGGQSGKKTSTSAAPLNKKRPRDEDNKGADDEERHHSRPRLDTPEPQDTLGQGRSSTSDSARSKRAREATESEGMDEERDTKRLRGNGNDWKGKGKETAHDNFPTET